jgi:HPt (histidine-containing phosphotransfer) domain-containing protein
MDMAKGLRSVGDNRSLLRKLLGDFHSDHSGDAEKIREALDQGDLGYAQRLAHTIKGIAGTIGAGELQLTAAELEDRLKAGDSQGALAGLDKTGTILAQLMAQLVCLKDGVGTPNRPPESAGPLDPVLASRLFDELSGLVEEMDPDAQEKLGEFAAALSGHTDPGLVRKLVDQVRGFDFDNARSTIEALRTKLLPDG